MVITVGSSREKYQQRFLIQVVTITRKTNFVYFKGEKMTRKQALIAAYNIYKWYLYNGGREKNPFILKEKWDYDTCPLCYYSEVTAAKNNIIDECEICPMLNKWPSREEGEKVKKCTSRFCLWSGRMTKKELKTLMDAFMVQLEKEYRNEN